MVLFLADDLPNANLHPLSSLLPKLFQIMNLIEHSNKHPIIYMLIIREILQWLEKIRTIH
jgi:hypothetical protein